MSPRFEAGPDIAMKLPKAQYDQTITFYRDILGMEVTEEESTEVAATALVRFGPMKLWLDRVDSYAQAELWLELFTDDVAGAVDHLREHGVPTQDELEPLPSTMDAHWISNPASIPHLVRRKES